MNELVLRGISLSLKKKSILQNVSLKMQSGNVYGVIGPNGSGKTMLLRIIAGLVEPNCGEVIWNGLVLHKDIEVIPNLGITIENAGLYPELSGYANLKILAAINRKIDELQIRQAIERLGLDPDDRRCIKKYSLGMKQRIAIAQAIMEDPDIVILDEPNNSLDPDGVQLVREIINEERDRGKIVIFASHSMEDIDMLADKVYLINRGECSIRDES